MFVHLAAVAALAAHIPGVVAPPPGPPPDPIDRLVGAAQHSKASVPLFFANSTIGKAAIDTAGIFYPRGTELADGTLLATGSVPRGPVPGYLPVYESKDGGFSWTYISNVTDKVNGIGVGAQPSTFVELSAAIGEYPAGTILISSNGWRAGGNATRIDLYASRDRGRTWDFVSHIAVGGQPGEPAPGTTEDTPIWEPFLLEYEGSLIAYYSDERDPKHSQKISLQVSKDLKTWGPATDAIVREPRAVRPGMPVIAFIPPIKKWILIYEQYIDNSTERVYGSPGPGYYVLADTPLKFSESEPILLLGSNTTPLYNSPFVIWSPAGGANGTLLVSDGSTKQIFTNRAAGDKDKWEEHAVPAGVTYSRSMLTFKNSTNRLLIFGGDPYGQALNGGTVHIPLSATVVNLLDVLEAPNTTDYPFSLKSKHTKVRSGGPLLA